MLMPYQVTLVPNFLVSKWVGIINTRWAIVLPGAFAPFSVFLLTKYMRRIPYSLIEAAKMEGAGSGTFSLASACLSAVRPPIPLQFWCSSTTGTWWSSRLFS